LEHSRGRLAHGHVEIPQGIVAIEAAEKRRPVFVAVVFPFQFVEMPGKECQSGFLGERRLGDGSWDWGLVQFS
jgi:hypothetical protein